MLQYSSRKLSKYCKKKALPILSEEIMLESGIVSITMFFVFSIICLIFVISWIIKSESKIKASRKVIEKLKKQVGTFERDKFILSEQAEAIESAQEEAQSTGSPSSDVILNLARKKSETLEEENKRLKSELNEARSSLEEVYKALS